MVKLVEVFSCDVEMPVYLCISNHRHTWVLGVNSQMQSSGSKLVREHSSAVSVEVAV